MSPLRPPDRSSSRSEPTLWTKCSLIEPHESTIEPSVCTASVEYASSHTFRPDSFAFPGATELMGPPCVNCSGRVQAAGPVKAGRRAACQRACACLRFELRSLAPRLFFDVARGMSHLSCISSCWFRHRRCGSRYRALSTPHRSTVHSNRQKALRGTRFRGKSINRINRACLLRLPSTRAAPRQPCLDCCTRH